MIRVLIVEDDEKSRRLLMDVLGAHGYDVCQAETGEMALDRIAEAPADIVLLDLQLPGMDGFATLACLRAVTGDTLPVVAVTASVMEGDKARIFAAGFTALIQKPVRLQMLLSTLDSLVEKTRGAGSGTVGGNDPED